MDIILTLVIAAGLAFIPATIAKNKGYSFGLWWFYGWMLFIVALIHALCLSDKNKATKIEAVKPAVPVGVAEELQKYKNLLDNGVITRAEFEAKKKQLLNL